MSVDVTSPEHLRWQRVHWITPLLKSWAALVVLLVLVLKNIGSNVKSILDGVHYAQGSHNQWVRMTPLLVPVGFLVLFVVVAGLITYVSWRFTQWALDEQAVHYRHGIISKHYRRVPLNRIQSIDVLQPLLARPFGLAKLHIESAGGADSHLDILYLKLSQVEDLAKEIRFRAAGRKVDPNANATATQAGQASENQNNPAAAPAFNNVAFETPQFRLYELQTSTLIKSILLGEGPWVLLVLLAGLVTALVGAILALTGVVPVSSVGAAGGVLVHLMIAFAWIIPLAVIPFSLGAGRFSREFRFRANVTADGIRLKSGLLETKTQTIPPGRVHAVQITQPLLWRLTGWWRVKMLIAGQISHGGNNEENKKAIQSNVLLPVGSYDEALRALWLVVRDLGVPDPDAFLQQALLGSGKSDGFTSVPKQAFWLDPLSWRRRAVASTQTVMVYRSGFLRRKLVVAPHERAQSVTLKQGPLLTLFGLADVHLDLVPGQVHVIARHLDKNFAHQLTLQENRLGKVRSQVEPAEDWALRISQAFGLQPQAEGL